MVDGEGAPDRARLPRAAYLRVVVHEAHGAPLNVDLGEPGAYRIETRIDGRVWLLANPAYLR